MISAFFTFHTPIFRQERPGSIHGHSFLPQDACLFISQNNRKREIKQHEANSLYNFFVAVGVDVSVGVTCNLFSKNQKNEILILTDARKPGFPGMTRSVSLM